MSKQLERCEMCLFWERFGGHQDGKPHKGGYCRRHAPVVTFVTDPDYSPEATFPDTLETDWCGDYKRGMTK